MNKFEGFETAIVAVVVGLAEAGAMTLALACGFVWCVILFGGV
jgi:enoyl-CoA hydratase/carnithine racemase